jgi:hypothetical protein
MPLELQYAPFLLMGEGEREHVWGGERSKATFRLRNGVWKEQIAEGGLFPLSAACEWMGAMMSFGGAKCRQTFIAL